MIEWFSFSHLDGSRIQQIDSHCGHKVTFEKLLNDVTNIKWLRASTKAVVVLVLHRPRLLGKYSEMDIFDNGWYRKKRARHYERLNSSCLINSVLLKRRWDPCVAYLNVNYAVQSCAWCICCAAIKNLSFYFYDAFV